MNGTELSELIDERHATLTHLLEISTRQMTAIRESRMGELMRLLSEKQSSLGRLTDLAAQTRLANRDDPVARSWESEMQRERFRTRQEACEQMHLELLAIEAQSEAALQQSREELRLRLDRADQGRMATHGYARSDSPPSSGEQLDLSSS